jgi:hypothetical protein
MIKYYKIDDIIKYKDYWYNNSIINFNHKVNLFYKERYINQQLYGIFIKKYKI